MDGFHEIPLHDGRAMACALPLARLRALAALQLANHFGPLDPADEEALDRAFVPALELLRRCLARVRNKYCRREGLVFLNPFHSGQYCLFLHFLTRALRQDEHAPVSLVERAYYLNRVMHGVDLFYDAGLPDVFYLEHPLGSCMGRASYSDELLFFQGCTVGGRPGEHPVLGRRLLLYAGASILGRCTIGANTVLSAGARVVNQDIPGDCMVFGASPGLVIKPLPASFFDAYFQPEEG